ncbi:hypothetical protein ACR3K2_11090 [Cryptosporidium serpentis]
MRVILLVPLLLCLLYTSAYGRLVRSINYGVLEPQFFPGTITSLIQTARKLIGSNIEPQSIIGEGTAQTKTEDSDKLYKKAVSESISVYQKAMNDASTNKLRQKDAVSQIPPFINPKPPACSVLLTTELGLALDATNIFDVDLLTAKITKDALIFMTDPQDSFTTVRSFALDKIEVPLESIQNSRKCFRMYFDTEPIVICAKSDAQRNEVMNKLTEAVFCINSGVTLTQSIGKVVDTGFADTALGMPPFTTKDLRWIEQIAMRQLQYAGKVQSNVLNWLKSRGTQHVVVKNPLGTNPIITVNGEKMV